MKSNATSFIPINRSLFGHFLWTEKRIFSRCEAWLDLLQQARFSESEGHELIGGRIIKWHRGQLPASVRFLEKSWSWGKHKVENFLALLVKEGMISMDSSQGQTVITVLNYESFNQLDRDKKKSVRGQVKQPQERVSQESGDTTNSGQKKSGQKRGQQRGQVKQPQERVSQEQGDSNGDTQGTARGHAGDETNNDNNDNNDNNVLNTIAENEFSASSEKPIKKSAPRKSAPEKEVTEHWHALVKAWFDFNKEKFGDEPSFEGKEGKDMKEIIKRLKSRAEKAKVEWTEENAVHRFKKFLENCYNDSFLSKNFLLSNLIKQFDKIILSHAQAASVNGHPTNGHSKVNGKKGPSVADILSHKIAVGDPGTEESDDFTGSQNSSTGTEWTEAEVIVSS